MLRFGLALIVLAGCVTGPASRPVQADRAGQEAACRAVVAAHEGVGQDEVQVELGADDAGGDGRLRRALAAEPAYLRGRRPVAGA